MSTKQEILANLDKLQLSAETDSLFRKIIINSEKDVINQYQENLDFMIANEPNIEELHIQRITKRFKAKVVVKEILQSIGEL
jgi:hypothetical protein